MMGEKMRVRLLAPLGVVLVLAGCARKTDTATEDPVGWGRVDCKRGAGDPVMEAQLEQAKAICSGRAQAAGLAGTAGMATGGRNIGDSIGNGIVAGVTQARITDATASSCMAEQGYLLRTLSSFEAACQPIWDQEQKQAAKDVKATRPPRKKPVPAAPAPAAAE